MKAMYREVLTLDNMLSHFPWDQYPEIRPGQREALEAISKRGSMALEAPTGTGKTAVGYTVLKTLAAAGMGPLFYIAPNKNQVNTVHSLHPDMREMYGRREYDCLYYAPDIYRADEIPCLSLLDCPHRVNIDTGVTYAEENDLDTVEPCPYYWPKFQAKQSPIVVCTAAFYLFSVFLAREFDEPAGLVIDEAHQMAKIVRSSLSFEITDYHLKQAIKVLNSIEAENEAQQLESFLKTMLKIIKKRSRRDGSATLLEDDELLMLIEELDGIDGRKLRKQLAAAIKAGLVDPRKEMVMLKRLESITYDLHRYIRSFEFSLPDKGRNALNYVTYAASERGQSEYRLVIKSYYVSPLVKKMMSPLTVAYSATIGDPEIFGYETGIKLPFISLPGTFPAENARVYLPKDTPNLSTRVRSSHEPAKVLRRIAKACKWYADRKIRTLVVVVSNSERDRFLRMADEEGVKVISYLNGSTPKDAMIAFKSGKGSTLVGTVANYGEGIDLPGEMAPVIFFLRPGYPNPNDPEAQFEERRFGGAVWRVRNWRVMIEALQVRGRNIRSADDKGVTIFISQHFRKFLYGALPERLKDAYRGDVTFEEAKQETRELLR
jgi:Rad3-related DNA helicase